MGKGNKQISEEKENSILQLYKNGVNCKQISEQLKTTEPTVKRVLSNFGINYKKVLEEKHQETYKEALDLYKGGAQLKKLCAELKIGPNTFKKYLRENDVQVLSQKQSLKDNMDKSEQAVLKRSSKRKRYELDENAFDDLTDPETAYWIGFIYTDGSIGSSANSYLVRIGLTDKDDEHLKKFCRFLKTPESRVRYSKSNNSCYVCISSVKLHNRLKELGFTNRKSYDAVPPRELANSKDFWRGCIDGDGCLSILNKKRYNKKQGHYIEKCPVIDICGTKDTCNGFKEFLESNLQNYNSNSNLSQKTNTFYTYRVSAKENVKQVTSLLYKDAKTYLERKYQKQIEMFKS